MTDAVQNMKRSDVVQGFLDQFDTPDYLEVGVASGETFHVIEARTKTGVDPKFRFDKTAFETDAITLHEITSDRFFGDPDLASMTYDVIYIDGLHTAEQTLRDLLNAQLFLKPGGVIIIDDVWPNSYVAAIRELDTFRTIRTQLGVQNKAWMGDVYKLLYFIDSFMQQFTMRIINDNYGQAVLWRQPRASVPDVRLHDTVRVSYTELLTDGRFSRIPVADVLAEFKSHQARLS